MTEKTAEEKLREMLEGGNDGGTSHERARVKPSRTRPKRNDTVRADTLDDLERRIEQSLNAANIQPGHQEKPRSTKKSSPHKPEAVSRKGEVRDVLGIMSDEPETTQAVTPSQPEIVPDVVPPEPEIVPEVTPSQNEQEIPKTVEPVIVPETVQAVTPSQPVTPEISPEIMPSQTIEPEIVPEIAPSESEIIPEITSSEPERVPEVVPSQPEIIPEIVPSSQEIPQAVEPEITPGNDSSQPEISQPAEPEITPEIIDPDPEPEIPEIPVIEAETLTPQENPEIPAGLPDIPLIEPDEDDYDDENNTIFIDDFTDIPVMADEPDNEPEPEQPIAPTELQESELFEVPETENEFDDDIDIAEEITPFDDEPLDESPAIPDEPDSFTPEADIVVNADDNIPVITTQEERTHDPESESVPVTVTMPEFTKTAEDKLMADIAEAMTGSPLSLDSQESSGLYNIPAGFFTEGASDTQSAEDKLKANIVQALSESPINTAQDQARQNLEDDLNPFDEMTDITYQPQEPETQPETPAEIEPESEPEQEEEEFLPDFMPYSENEPQEEITPEFDFANDDSQESEPEITPESEIEIEPEIDTQPEIMPESEPEIEPAIEPESEHEADIESEPEIDIEPKITPEPEHELTPEFDTEPATEIQPEIESSPAPEPETEDEPDPFTIPDMLFDDEPETETPPANHEPLTEQERLAQEVAAMSQEFDAENTHEEAQQENTMPDENLIDTAEDIAPADDADEFDISSLGGAAQIIPEAPEHDPEPAPVPTIPETVTEVITEKSAITRKPENQRKEKIMGIREKLASRKNGNSSGGILLPILLGALIIIGGLMLWQLMQLSDKLTSLAMNSGGDYSASSYESNPSYSYAIDFILDPNLADRMAQRGRDGWQVVGSRRTQDSTTGQYGYEFIFMRRIPGR